MANTNIFEPFVFETGTAGDNRAGGDRTPKKPDRVLAGSLSPSSTKLVNPLALVDTPLDSTGVPSIYCAPCKKKFSSEATFEAHLQSDKHKKSARQAPSSSLPASPKSKSKLHPVVQGALSSMKKAQALATKDPAVAATVLWNIAQDIAQFGEDFVTRTVLDSALSCMQAMDANTDLRGVKGSPGAWSARSLLKTMLECQLARARLESRSNKQLAASLYADALCCYLGIPIDSLDIAERDRNPTKAWALADQLVNSIPRKFAKSEDIDQATGAMEEVAAALFAFSKTESNTLLWRSVAITSMAHVFALQKERTDVAFLAVRRLVALFDSAGLGHFSSECANLVIDHHMQQPGSRAMVATAVVNSLRGHDLVRASCILQKYNYRFEEPWSRFLAQLVGKTADADTIWLSTDAWKLWTQISNANAACDRHIYDLIESAVQRELRPLMWYSPAETN
ncbi:hypothetical protein GGI09_004255 [Coemansia sp. S100]|nr:hypothetical protein LPJ71_001516 [Coemansia sp. S17]KAJ2019208.1 hypothetical protein GGI14_001769 [Coemansia sp. S680]KAJ2035477.1 hypothetical protein H4S03_004288 [Coemansia sp. S3946]KAJ2093934.1 hypothetical protein GGI16_005723 [Coemansia sp. S142-1]KAJ2096632.1 hypothetical protein GGI09_004255 [Coemansia sp. S100]